MSEATETCIGCHSSLHPGIVEDWSKSRHSAVSPAQAMGVPTPSRKISAKNLPDTLKTSRVGCAECHTLRPSQHRDTFEHNGYDIHVVVSPDDCRTCHTTEADQYRKNIMSHAVGNLRDNPVYHQLETAILGQFNQTTGRFSPAEKEPLAREGACYYCHGTRLSVKGTETRDTEVGELIFPVISGWPNQGCGRINLDGSKGTCTACHPRHRFSMAMARKPEACRECHMGPDVPAYKVYMTSKHGSIYSAQNAGWNFDATPWTLGKDFTTPTCAACHISQLADTDGNQIQKRSHEMKDRLSWRLFGLIYAHPQPVSPDTTIIRNRAGLPLPTDFDGRPADRFLITTATQKKRTQTLQATCLACHDTSWVRGHWNRFDATLKRTQQDIRVLTEMVQAAWKEDLATGIKAGGNPFDEAIERMWCDGWLFYATTIRFTSAMAGGGDYGVFADGRYHLSGTQIRMHDWLAQRRLINRMSK
ncbi:MAG: hydroxylamine oxidase [Deltaproteobacteria bacterium]|nr:MAG: hydroxylamine oxidase [Deltaproteobacteria bacterium]